MTSLIESLTASRRFLDLQHIRHTLSRRRRIVAAILAGLGVVFLISSLRTPAPVALESASPDAALSFDEVAVPVVIRPGVVVGALAPGMNIDLIADGHTTREARIIRIPASGFGPTSDAVVVVAVSEDQGLTLASHASAGMSVMIRPTADE